MVAAINDGASPNRKFFNLHSNLVAEEPKQDIVYKTLNVFAMSRFIFFFADSPHLLKTARNCLYNSGSGSRSQLMWNDGNYVLFRHIANLFYSDQELALHSLPKLTLDHIVLTSYSKMKVKLATQQPQTQGLLGYGEVRRGEKALVKCGHMTPQIVDIFATWPYYCYVITGGEHIVTEYGIH